jgi:hypothetical protein
LAAADRIGQVLVVHLEHLGLVVVQVHLRRAADHVQVDDVACLGREVRPAGLGGVGLAVRAGAVGAEERRQGGRAEREAGRGEELATSFQAVEFAEEAHNRSSSG